MKKSSILLSMVVSLGLGLGFSGCSDDSSKKEDSQTSTKTVQYLNFTTGGVNGMYYPQGQIIAKNMADKGYSMNVVSSDGGEQNGRRVVKGISDFGFIQKDTHNLLSTLDNEYANNVNVVSVLGKEAILFVVNKNGAVKNEKDLKEVKAKIVMSSKSSGAVSSLNTMSKINKDFANKEIVFKEFNQAVKELKMGTVDALMFVQSVQSGNKNLETILQDKDLAFIDIEDKDLTNKKLNGKVIYDDCNVSVAEGLAFDKKVKTICTEALVISNVNIKEEITNKMSEIIEKNKVDILKAKSL